MKEEQHKIEIFVDGKKVDNYNQAIIISNNKNGTVGFNLLGRYTNKDLLHIYFNLTTHLISNIFACMEIYASQNSFSYDYVFDNCFDNIASQLYTYMEEITTFTNKNCFLTYCEYINKYKVLRKKFSKEELQTLLEEFNINIPNVQSINLPEFIKQLRKELYKGMGLTVDSHYSKALNYGIDIESYMEKLEELYGDIDEEDEEDEEDYNTQLDTED